MPDNDLHLCLLLPPHVEVSSRVPAGILFQDLSVPVRVCVCGNTNTPTPVLSLLTQALCADS